MQSSRRYLVTGGCGFIGSHLADALLDAGHDVRVLDNLSSGFRENLSPRAELVEGDLRDAKVLQDVTNGVDGVYHLAAVASVQQCIEDWRRSTEVNLLGSVSLFDLMASCGKPVVYASSAAIYGDATPPCDLTALPKPLSPYGVDKYGMELHAAAAAVTHGLRSFGLRFFNVYGPRQNASSPYSGVISIFAERIAKGEGITLFGDGLQSRDFVYVRDAVRALIAAMTDLETSSAGRAEVENVGTGNAIDLLSLAEVIGEITGQTVQLSHEKAREGDIRHSYSKPSGRLKDLGALAQTPLSEGLRNLLNN